MPNEKPYDLVVVGAGAAGFFASAETLRLCPDARVLMLEKTSQVLAKVRISGGGRCNVTHNCFDNSRLQTHYPRGNSWLSGVFKRFSVKDTLSWFSGFGVKIVPESDGRMFPASNRSESIVQALQESVRSNNFRIRANCLVKAIKPENEGAFELLIKDSESIFAANVLVATGGSPGPAGFSFLSPLQLPLVSPVPSLFTFNVAKHDWASLMGLAVEKAAVSLPAFGLSFQGPVLVTHWGFSGPAVLKLSAAAARLLHDCGYIFEFQIDFLPDLSRQEIEQVLLSHIASNPKQKPSNAHIFEIPKRLWDQLCLESGLANHHNWAEAGKKKLSLIVELLKSKRFHASGKTTFKDEFVTAGGVSLEAIDSKTCQSKSHPGIFLAGEVLDVDGFTGGFNFQAAWSTGYVAALAISERISKKNQ